MHTNIDMPADVSEKMIKNMSWKKFPNKDVFYFGCDDNKDSGCPNIRYYPASESSESEVEISFFQP
jgi:hypothetical protein